MYHDTEWPKYQCSQTTKLTKDTTGYLTSNSVNILNLNHFSAQVCWSW